MSDPVCEQKINSTLKNVHGKYIALAENKESANGPKEKKKQIWKEWFVS